MRLSWSGQQVDGKWHGRGVLLTENSMMKGRDEGEYVQGVRQGRWVEIYGDTRRDEGEYVNNKKQGLWVETYANGTRREGEYAGGRKQGKWIETQASGSRIEGGYVYGKKTGVWVETRADGTRWEQEWESDAPARNEVACPFASLAIMQRSALSIQGFGSLDAAMDLSSCFPCNRKPQSVCCETVAWFTCFVALA